MGSPSPSPAAENDALRPGLRELGYVEGQNVVLEPRWADGRHERLPELAADLVRLKADVIVSAATPASRAAKAATSSIPIVIVGVGEPVKTGLIASLARPGGNVTGLSLLTTELSGKRLELLADVVRNIPRVAGLLNPDNPVNAVFLEETRDAARRLGIELQPFQARNLGEIEKAFEAATGNRAAALIVFDDPVIWSYRALIVAHAAKRRLPVMYGRDRDLGARARVVFGVGVPDPANPDGALRGGGGPRDENNVDFTRLGQVRMRSAGRVAACGGAGGPRE